MTGNFTMLGVAGSMEWKMHRGARHNTENVQVLKYPRRGVSGGNKLDAFEQASRLPPPLVVEFLINLIATEKNETRYSLYVCI